jgi:site-specific recombinase XerD
MDISELQKNPIIIEWFDTIQPSHNTIKSYLFSMKMFTQFTGNMPEELIEEAEKDIKQGTLPRLWKAKKHLLSFRKHMQDKGLADKTIQGQIAAIKSFYSAFDIEITKLRNDRAVTVLEENLPIPSKEDLQEALKVCNPLEKSVLLVGVSSGLSAVDITKLTVKQFRDGYDKDTKITTLSIRRTKTKTDFVTFLSPECSQAVQDYLNYRNRIGKTKWDNKHSQAEKQKVYNNDNYLFCLQNVPNIYLKSKNENERQLREYSIIRIYRSISTKAQKNAANGSWNLLRSHNCRKFFNSTLLNAGVDSFLVSFLMGHTLDSTKSAYFRASPERLREIYARYVPYLTIAPEQDISESPEYQKIKQENQILQAETARHVVERSELIEMQRKMKNMDDFLIAIANGDQKVIDMLHFLKKEEEKNV